MKVEVKNVKIAEFASEETLCYSATVYVDGKRFCLAKNSGHGGPDIYSPLPGETMMDVNAGLAVYEPMLQGESADTDFRYVTAFEMAVAEALDRYMILKQMKRELRNRVLFLDGKSIKQMKSIVPKKNQTALLFKRMRETFGEHIRILNELPQSEALELFEQYG